MLLAGASSPPHPFPHRFAALAPFRLVHESFLRMKLLLPRGKHKLLPAINARQRLILEFHWSPPATRKTISALPPSASLASRRQSDSSRPLIGPPQMMVKGTCRAVETPVASGAPPLPARPPRPAPWLPHR